MSISATLPEKCLSPADLCRMFDVHRDTLRWWEKRGLLPPPMRVGNILRWHPDVILEFALKRGLTGTPIPGELACSAQEETPGPTNPEVSGVRSQQLELLGGGDVQRPEQETAVRAKYTPE